MLPEPLNSPRLLLRALLAGFFSLQAVSSEKGPAILLTQVPIRSAAARDAGWDRGGDLAIGSRVVLVGPSGAAGVRVLTRGFAAAGRPSLSFDGRRFLFVGRKGVRDPLSIWEQGIDGRGLRRVAGFDGDCMEAIHASNLFGTSDASPAPWIVFSGRASGASAPALFAVREDGSQLRQITFNPLGASHPVLLDDGRLLYSGGVADGRGAALFTVYADGEDVSPFAPSPGPGVLQERAAGGFLVAYRPEPGATYGIFRRQGGTSDRLEPVFDAPGWHDLDPVAVVPRAVPAGRSSAVDDRSDEGATYCLDAGGSVAFVDVYRASRGVEVLLGRVPVEADGSFHVRVPARLPLRLETIDAQGRVLRAMQGSFWVMGKETRGCIGCHEDHDLSPPNRFALAFRRPPRVLGGESR